MRRAHTDTTDASWAGSHATARNADRAIRLMLPVLAAALSACQSDIRETAGIPVQIEDSAGVRIVEYMGTPVTEAPFRFPPEPRYRHGTNPGDYAFQGVQPGSLFPDGSAVVSDVLNRELIVLSPDGASHEVFAGPGEGPGDVSYVGATFALGQDRFMAVDFQLDRLTIFDGGSVERTVDIRHADPLSVLGIGESGQLLGTANLLTPDFEEEWLPGHMARFDMETGTLDTVASYDLLAPAPPGIRWTPIGDSEGRVWLPAYQPAVRTEGAPQYTVISGDGEWLGTVEAPPRFRILDVVGGLVLGVQMDAMDVENVVVYELVGAG